MRFLLVVLILTDLGGRKHFDAEISGSFWVDNAIRGCFRMIRVPWLLAWIGSSKTWEIYPSFLVPSMSVVKIIYNA